MPEPTSFDALRSWEGLQSRAFEELTYQLLRTDVPDGATAIRTGNPDGGVEWYAQLSDDTEYGWQAKHVHGIDALLTAMTESVRRVVLERPNLRKLTFVISWNLATSTQGRERKSQRQKYEDKVATWQMTIAGAAAIEFMLVQGSDLLAILSLPEHRGRQWFWWNAPTLGLDWFIAFQRQQADAAGERYRPDLQVDLPISEDLRGLGFAQSLLNKFRWHRQRVLEALSELRLPSVRRPALTRAYGEIRERVSGVGEFLERYELLPTTVRELDVLEHLADACSKAIWSAIEIERQLHKEWKALPPSKRKRRKEPPDAASSYRARAITERVEAISALLGESYMQTMRRPAYFLTGEAGSGKTHLLLDAAAEALEAKRPAFVLFGRRFGEGDVWGSVCDQLGLPPLGTDALLDALDSAAEASGLAGSRCLIMIDALNETPNTEFWRAHLPALRAAVARRPHLALVVSCRDTYVNIIDEDGTEQRQFVQRRHPGFAGREVEAAHKFFAHYQLEAPRIPLLTPEFTVPLFLRLYCEGLHDEGVSALGHESRIEIFERFLRVKIRRIARRLAPRATTDYERDVATRQAESLLREFVTALSVSGGEVMSLEQAEQLARTALPDGQWAPALGAFQSEGLFNQELMYLGDGKTQQGLRISFQAFADFLILQRRFADSTDPLRDDGLRGWLKDDCSWGVLEAAAVYLPEAFRTELPDYLGAVVPTKRSHECGEHGSFARTRAIRNERVYASFFEMLPYRTGPSVTDRTIELLNQSLRLVSPKDMFRTIVMIAPQPDNPLNGDRLDKYLRQFKMPLRDQYFGVTVYDEIWDEASPITRLARWAADGPYPDYDEAVVRLAAVPLVWLMSSPNRFMRDWVTKALVQLFRGHLRVGSQILEQFWDVDDPYVLQRAVVIAYGALMRGGEQDLDTAKALAECTLRLVFTRPMTRPDELMLDAARGIVNWAVCRDLLPLTARDQITRPYGFKRPAPPASEGRLTDRYGFVKDQPVEESYSTLFSSVMGLGDFGHYVVESGMRHFSRHRSNKPRPVRQDRTPRPRKAGWAKFVRSLTEEQRTAYAADLVEPNLDWRFRFGRGRDSSLPDLSQDQWDLFDEVWIERQALPDDDYPAGLAKRWIFQRTLTLGWTPARFGTTDRSLSHRDRGRVEHKSERWGKKYQWMAYHELLARVADNYHSAHRFGEVEPYVGLHQITAEREIDPSVPPVGYRDFIEGESEDDVPSWPDPPITISEWPPSKLDFQRFNGDIRALLADRASEPSEQTLSVTDDVGQRWIILDSYVVQMDPGAQKRWHGLRQPYVIDSWLAPKDQAGDLSQCLSRLRERDRHDLVDDHGHIDCCYAGEIGWTSNPCYNAHDKFISVETDEGTWQVAHAVETQQWEGNILDCSIRSGVFAAMPSSFIQQRAKLRLQQEGPSWVDENGTTVLVNYNVRAEEQSRALLVRADWLASFLESNDMELLYGVYFERTFWDSDDRRPRPYVDVYTSFRLDANLKFYRDPHPVRREGNLGSDDV